jgi:hypothetical protein
MNKTSQLHKETDQLKKETVQIYREIALLRKETEELHKETEQVRQGTEQVRQETEQVRKESEQVRKEADEVHKRAGELHEENEQLRKENQALQKDNAQQIRELRVQLGGLGDKFGSFTEGLALPSMTKILTRRFHMNVVLPRLLAESNGRSFEVDVMAYSEFGVDEVYLVEVKSHLRQEAIVQMKRTLREFRQFFPGHSGKKIYGILAAVDAPARIAQKVLAEGIYLARIHDGEFELQVPDAFQPRAF